MANFVDFDSKQSGLADYDSDGYVTVNDATNIQYYLAAFPESLQPKQETVSVNQGNPLSSEYKVLFSNSRHWDTNKVYCHCWNGAGYVMCAWPGGMMKKVGTNGLGEEQYEFTVPAEADHVIFSGISNGQREQTVDIPLDRYATGYFLKNEVDGNGHYHFIIDKKGHYYWDTWNTNE